MAGKFHINKHGVPAPCKAKEGNCPLGGVDTHFDTQKEAQAYIDNKSAEEYGLLTSVQSNPRHDVDRFDRLDRLVEHMGSERLGEELSQHLDQDILAEVNSSIVYDYDLEDYVDQDCEAYEQYDQIAQSIGYETSLEELAKNVDVQTLQESIDYVEDIFDLSEENNDNDYDYDHDIPKENGYEMYGYNYVNLEEESIDSDESSEYTNNQIDRMLSEFGLDDDDRTDDEEAKRAAERDMMEEYSDDFDDFDDE